MSSLLNSRNEKGRWNRLVALKGMVFELLLVVCVRVVRIHWKHFLDNLGVTTIRDQELHSTENRYRLWLLGYSQSMVARLQAMIARLGYSQLWLQSYRLELTLIEMRGGNELSDRCANLYKPTVP